MISPAKGNLFFRVLRKRSDGFHEIASLYTALSLVDTLSLSRAKRDAYNRPELDLVTKARDLFRKKTGICDPVAVHLEKRIPMGAGLGGGSSNAATMLYGMNQLLGSPVSEATLALWGAELGSDVPFFFSHGAAYCTGRGEIVRDAEWEEGCWIAKPKAMLKTPDVYRRCVPREGGEEMYVNDLEMAAFQLLPELRELKYTLKKVFKRVVMTGSGTAFLCFEGEPPDLDVAWYQVRPMRRKQGQWYG